MLPACIAQFLESWVSLMTSWLANASAGRAARPSRTPHWYVRIDAIWISSFCMLMGGPRLRGAQQEPCALLLELYTRAGENAPLARALFRAGVALPLTVPKANNREPRCVKNEGRARRAGLAPAPWATGL